MEQILQMTQIFDSECSFFYRDLYATKSTKITEDLEKKILAMDTHTKSTELIKRKMRGSLN